MESQALTVLGQDRTAEQSLRKSFAVINGHRLDVRLLDDKLFNYLYCRCFRDLMTTRVHRIRTKDLLDYLGHTSTDQLQESLARLGRAVIEVKYVDEAGAEHRVSCHFLSFDMTRSENGWVEFAFDPILVKHMHEPKIYATLQMWRVREFRSKYALWLYEMMSGFAHRNHKIWSVTVDEFRAKLGVEAHESRFDNLKRGVIDVAVNEVNERADFDVSVTYERAGRGGKVVKLHFTVENKRHDRMMERRSVDDPVGRKKRAERDRLTPDMLDGKTDVERGGLPVLKPETLAEARAETGQDPAPLVAEWTEENAGRRMKNPDLNFLRWVELRKVREGLRDAGVHGNAIASLYDEFRT